jgi:hypothetical protein
LVESLSNSDQQQLALGFGYFVSNAEAFCGITPILADCHKFLPQAGPENGKLTPFNYGSPNPGRKP